MRPERFASQCPTEVKVELVLRLLAGETLADVACEAGRPRKQLAAWRDRFLAGGEAHLDGRLDLRAMETSLAQQREMSAKLDELEAENRLLERRIALGKPRPPDSPTHPTCSEAYAHALEQSDLRALQVPEWGTYVLVRESGGDRRQATGIRPLAGLDPNCEVKAGLERLQREGINSISLVTDPMWCPELPALEEAFDNCRAFKDYYVIDRVAKPVRISKRHRNKINRARRIGQIQEVSLSDHLERWHELYAENVVNRRIAQPFSTTYFERLADFQCLRTLAVVVRGGIASMSLWIHYEDVLYFHEAASSTIGFEALASYAAFAHAIEEAADCRYVFLGGSGDFRGSKQDGLAVFRRGFANATLPSYLCSATLNSI